MKLDSICNPLVIRYHFLLLFFFPEKRFSFFQKYYSYYNSELIDKPVTIGKYK